MKARAELHLRVVKGRTRAIGPGKIALLEAIRDTGSPARGAIAKRAAYCSRYSTTWARVGYRGTSSAKGRPGKLECFLTV